jgi:hypothetical protein
MSSSAGPNLGVVITDPTVRKVIYGIYVLSILVAGAFQVGYAAGSITQPSWLTIALAVIGYLGVPVGGLAFLNAPKQGIVYKDGQGKFE